MRDIEASTRFYCQAFRFVEAERMRFDDDATAQLLGVPGLDLELVYLEKDGVRIELLGYRAPGTSATWHRVR